LKSALLWPSAAMFEYRMFEYVAPMTTFPNT
jgi:hypothetical protein